MFQDTKVAGTFNGAIQEMLFSFQSNLQVASIETYLTAFFEFCCKYKLRHGALYTKGKKHN